MSWGIFEDDTPGSTYSLPIPEVLREDDVGRVLSSMGHLAKNTSLRKRASYFDVGTPGQWSGGVVTYLSTGSTICPGEPNIKNCSTIGRVVGGCSFGARSQCQPPSIVQGGAIWGGDFASTSSRAMQQGRYRASPALTDSIHPPPPLASSPHQDRWSSLSSTPALGTEGLVLELLADPTPTTSPGTCPKG